MCHHLFSCSASSEADATDKDKDRLSPGTVPSSRAATRPSSRAVSRRTSKASIVASSTPSSRRPSVLLASDASKQQHGLWGRLASLIGRGEVTSLENNNENSQELSAEEQKRIEEEERKRREEEEEAELKRKQAEEEERKKREEVAKQQRHKDQKRAKVLREIVSTEKTLVENLTGKRLLICNCCYNIIVVERLS